MCPPPNLENKLGDLDVMGTEYAQDHWLVPNKSVVVTTEMTTSAAGRYVNAEAITNTSAVIPFQAHGEMTTVS